MYLTGFVIMFLFVLKEQVSLDERECIDGKILKVEWPVVVFTALVMSLVWPLMLIAVIADIISDSSKYDK